MTAKILTLHPEGKAGVNLDAAKYEQVCTAICNALDPCGELAFNGLVAKVGEELAGKFEGSMPWYTTTIKLYLEARGDLECIRNRGPQRVRRPGK